MGTLSFPYFVFAHNTDTIIDQEHYRFYDDDGTTVNNATGLAAIDAAASLDTGVVFHLRLGALQTANKPDLTLTRTVKLQFSTDAAGTCSSGTWTDVPTETGWGSEAFRQITTGNFADGDTTTRILDSTHTHIGGDGVETDGAPDTASFSGANASTEHAEWEWALEEKSGATQTYYFRFINSDDTTTNVTFGVCAELSVAPAAVAPAELIQHSYKWFANTDSVDVGGSTGINSPTTAPNQSLPFRLRMLLYNEGATTIGVSGTTTDLQVAVSDGFCDGDETYSDVSSASGDIRYYTGNSPADGTNLTANVFDPVATSSAVTIRNQDYEDANTFTNSVAAIAENEAGMWDFALYDFSAPFHTTYCFRAVQSGANELLSGGYDVFPEIITAAPLKTRLRGAIRLRTVRLR